MSVRIPRVTQLRDAAFTYLAWPLVAPVSSEEGSTSQETHQLAETSDCIGGHSKISTAMRIRANSNDVPSFPCSPPHYHTNVYRELTPHTCIDFHMEKPRDVKGRTDADETTSQVSRLWQKYRCQVTGETTRVGNSNPSNSGHVKA
jgi:hypothetical protein